MTFDAKTPSGPLSETWDRHRTELKLVSPANKRKYRVIVVGTGLAGASAAASLAELGYHVDALPVSQPAAESAMDAAACISCGACVAACKNASAMLFTAAKVSHLASLPQGHPERAERTKRMIAAMDAEHFGSCTNQSECEAVCPKQISVDWIAKLNREHLAATVGSRQAG